MITLSVITLSSLYGNKGSYTKVWHLNKLLNLKKKEFAFVSRSELWAGNKKTKREIQKQSFVILRLKLLYLQQSLWSLFALFLLKNNL